MVYAAKSASGGPIVYKRFTVQHHESAQFADEVACHKALYAKGGHPNVLMALRTFHDPAKQEAVITMEAGVMDLQALLKSQSYCVGAPVAIVLLNDITQGLSYIHTCGIIHRDLKPCNIILCLRHSGNGRLIAKISDFGCSRIQSCRPTETLNFCTCLYRAPEVFELVQPAWFTSGSPVPESPAKPAIGSAIADINSIGAHTAAESRTELTDKQELMQRYSFAADVWSLGCLYAEFLHGRVLFQSNGNTDVSLLATIAARIGLPSENTLAIKGWPNDRILDLAKATCLTNAHRSCLGSIASFEDAFSMCIDIVHSHSSNAKEQ